MAIQCVRGPDVAAVGWIPFFTSPKEVAQRPYSTHPCQIGMRLLFNSGNTAPPPNFADEADFRSLLASKDFRGALVLRNVRLHCDAAGGALTVDFDSDRHIGYTPYRLVIQPL